MNKQEEHYRSLTGQIRDQKVNPPMELREQFDARTVKPTVVKLTWKKWAIAASVMLAVGLTWINFYKNSDHVLTFPAGVTVERFNGPSESIDPHYIVDRNFHQLRISYEKLNF